MQEVARRNSNHQYCRRSIAAVANAFAVTAAVATAAAAVAAAAIADYARQ